MRPKHWLWIACVLLLLSSIAFAGAPTLSITGPSRVPAGSAVFLQCDTDAVSIDWIVFPLSASGNFVPLQLYQGQDANGKPIVKHAAFFSTPTPGTYTIVVVGTKQDQLARTVHTLVNGDVKPEPGPQPDPEPNPNPFPVPPAKALVLVLAESGDRSAEIAATMHRLSQWLVQQKIAHRVEDPNLKDANNQPAKWIQPYMERAKTANVTLPALFVGARDGETVTNLTVVPLPASGDAAIEAVKGRLAK